MWWRRTRSTARSAQARMEQAVTAATASAERLAARVERLERRVGDVEDAACAGLAPDRIDLLSARVDDLELMTVTHTELMEVRMHSARARAELGRLAAEVRGQADEGWTATA